MSHHLIVVERFVSPNDPRSYRLYAPGGHKAQVKNSNDEYN